MFALMIFAADASLEFLRFHRRERAVQTPFESEGF